MKLQFGILYRDNERVADRQDLATLLGEYASYNAETSGEHFDGPLLMGYRGDRITWEEDSETQPYTLGPYTITFDGRLDNREDIAAKVGIVADRNLPDPTLILQAYEKCGDSLLPDLIGEFALVIWRSDTRELTFCRSVDGARPLYYTQCKTLCWSSDITHLLHVTRCELALDRRYILGYLLGAPSSELTPFLSVAAVKAGTYSRFVGASMTPATKLWEPLDIRPLSLKSDAEYEERFRDEFQHAVRVRLRTKHSVMAELSGGLDSSSVVLVAHDLLVNEKKTIESLATISMVYDQSRTTDERYFIHHVECCRGVNSIYVSEAELAFSFDFNDLRFTGLPSLYELKRGKFAQYARHMQQHNARVLLTGIGGDDLLCSTPFPETLIADLLQQWHLLSAHRSCKCWSRFSALPYLTLLLAQALPVALNRRRPFCENANSPKVPTWLVLNGYKEDVIQYSQQQIRKGLLASHTLRIALVESFFRRIAMGLWSNYGSIYLSHPYSHRPLVDFCIAVPFAQMQRNGETRSLQRRALARILPDKIVNRKGKALLNEPHLRAIQTAWEHLRDVAEWRLCIDGYIRADEFIKTLREMRVGCSSPAGSFVPFAISLERFLRALSSTNSNCWQSV
ncbi:MAG TPA: asparagine synthase-related protein [Terriglobales bacterium]|jgi:asparagine synthase (glutamine-hydrolysing)|nr:asparagine synthase-related protein [Terriglobales bacterium]